MRVWARVHAFIRGRQLTMDRKYRPIFGSVCCQDALTADVYGMNQLVVDNRSIFYRVGHARPSRIEFH